jgi:hypothetical protein
LDQNAVQRHFRWRKKKTHTHTHTHTHHQRSMPVSGMEHILYPVFSRAPKS